MNTPSGFKTAFRRLMGILLLLQGPAGAAAPQAADKVFQQSATDGLIVIEAERAGGNTPQGGHTWDPTTTPAGYVGTGAMASNPNSGAGVDTGYVAGSPRLDFRVLFNTTGRHYLWVRGRALTAPATGNNDSCHTGLNNTAVASADRLGGWGDAWTWRNNTMDAARATVEVTTTGIHTVNLWMREDGFLADRILLTTNAGYAGVSEGGTMAGPAQSPEIAVTIPGTPALSAVGETGQVTLSWGPVTHANTYTLLRSTTPGGPYTTVATGLTGTSYVDLSVTTGLFYYYVLHGVSTLFGQGPPSNEASAEAISDPRTNDHEEGASDGQCACGSTGMPGISALWMLLAAGPLLGRRKPR